MDKWEEELDDLIWQEIKKDWSESVAIFNNVYPVVVSFIRRLIKTHPGMADGMNCPRCGLPFHDEDIKSNPEQIYTCDKCGTIEHMKCRGSLPIENIKKEDENERIRK